MPVDLNAIMAVNYRRMCEIGGKYSNYCEFHQNLLKQIQKHLWNQTEKSYFDHHNYGLNPGQKIDYYASNFFPLWLKAGNNEVELIETLKKSGVLDYKTPDFRPGTTFGHHFEHEL